MLDWMDWPFRTRPSSRRRCAAFTVLAVEVCEPRILLCPPSGVYRADGENNEVMEVFAGEGKKRQATLNFFDGKVAATVQCKKNGDAVVKVKSGKIKGKLTMERVSPSAPVYHLEGIVKGDGHVQFFDLNIS